MLISDSGRLMFACTNQATCIGCLSCHEGDVPGLEHFLPFLQPQLPNLEDWGSRPIWGDPAVTGRSTPLSAKTALAAAFRADNIRFIRKIWDPQHASWVPLQMPLARQQSSRLRHSYRMLTRQLTTPNFYPAFALMFSLIVSDQSITYIQQRDPRQGRHKTYSLQGMGQPLLPHKSPRKDPSTHKRITIRAHRQPATAKSKSVLYIL